MPKVTTYTRNRIDCLFKEGLRPVEIVKVVKREGLQASFSSVTRIVRKIQQTGSTKNLPGSGRPKTLSAEAKAFVEDQMRKNDEATSIEIQDNDPKHTSRRAQAFMENNGINWWRTPPESPDLNPIEDLWHELKFYLASKVKPQTKQQLVDGIRKFWTEKLTADKCSRYIDHVLKKVIPVVVEACGAATQY